MTAFTDFAPRTARARARRLSTSSSLVPKKKRSFFACVPMNMQSLFNITRIGILVAVLLWSIICLAIAVHFQQILIPSDLTHFVPFAIFVSAASLAVVLILLGSTLFKRRSPVSTRVELLGLGLIAVLWLALGVFLILSDSAEADVECFSADSADDEEPIDMPGFSTETYQAQYRVLEAFSLFNVILVWAFLLLLLFLAIREHRRNHKEAWYFPVPIYPWFEGAGSPYKNHKSSRRDHDRLPSPVTAKGAGARRSPRQTEKARAPAPRQSSFWVWVERPKDPPKAHTRDRRKESTRRTPARTNTTTRR